MPSRLAPLYLAQRLLAFLVVLDVNLDKYGVTGSSVKLNSRNKTLTKLLKTYWAEQISCPSSLVPYLLAPQHTPKPCLLDDANLAFWIKRHFDLFTRKAEKLVCSKTLDYRISNPLR